MSFDLNQHSLLQFLHKQKFEPIFQKESNQIYISLKIGAQEVPIFFVIRSESQLLQMVAYLPFQLHQKFGNEVARMLHLLNKELDMPGFGMDENENLLFYRSVIPCLDGKVNEKLLGLHIGTTQAACDTFIHAIAAVASGSMTMADVFGKEKP